MRNKENIIQDKDNHRIPYMNKRKKRQRSESRSNQLKKKWEEEDRMRK